MELQLIVWLPVQVLDNGATLWSSIKAVSGGGHLDYFLQPMGAVWSIGKN